MAPLISIQLGGPNLATTTGITKEALIRPLGPTVGRPVSKRDLEGGLCNDFDQGSIRGAQVLDNFTDLF